MSVLDELRQTTRIDHEAVEQLVAIDRPDFGVHDYAAFLSGMLAAHEPFEHGWPALPQLRLWLPDLTSRAKAVLLRRDLRQLGREPVPADPHLDTGDVYGASEALGALYVLEGSTLGARFVLARLVPLLGADIRGATQYLEAYGETRAERWHTFTAALESAATDAGSRAALVTGAGRMFARVRALLSHAMARD